MTADSETADVFDFVDLYLADLERGEDRPLAYWLERFPRSQAAIAREWLTLRQPGTSASADGATATSSASVDTKDRVGPYRILRELGRGGQGTVFLAEDTRIARRVALKMLTSRFDSISDEKRLRFKREADVIAKLEHPGLCSIHDADLTGDAPWIAMRFIEGRTLGECLVEAKEKGGAEILGLRFPPTNTVEIHAVLSFFERAARALHAAHEGGVVHRDVKPGNVIVAVDGRPVLLDFGLARDETSETGTLTQSGDVFGTPAYMSPEQLSLPSSDLDRRTDVYSLGIALYEALTLERPFENAAKSLLYRAIQSDPPPDPRKKNKALSEDVKVVLETALEKERARRYLSTFEFAEDLRRIREYEPIRARPASVAVKLERWVRRHPALAVAISGTIASLAIGLVVTLKLLANERDALRGKDDALDVALGKHLAQRAVALSAEDPPTAVVLGIKGVEKAPGELTRSSLFTALDACWLMTTIGNETRGLQIENIATSAVGNLGAVAFDDGSITIVSLDDGLQVAHIESKEHAQIALAFDANGTRLLAASDSGVVRFHDAKSGAMIVERALAGPLSCVRSSSDGTQLVAFGSEIGGVVLDAQTLKPLAQLACANDEFTRGEFTARGHSLVAWETGGNAAVFAATGARMFDVASGGGTSDAAFSEGADASRLLIAGVDGALHVLDASDGREIGPTLRFPLAPTLLVASPDGRHVAVATNRGEEGAAYLLDVALGTSTVLGYGLGRRVTQLSFSPDHTRLATTAHDSKVRLYEVPTGRMSRSITATIREQDVAWSSDGEHLLTRSIGGAAEVWFARVAPDVFDLEGHTDAVRAVEFSPDGKLASTASLDGTARIWNVDPHDRKKVGREIARLTHPGPVQSARFSSDGTLVLTVGAGVEARTWSAIDGRPLRDFAESGSALVAAELDPTGERFATLSVDGRARIWPSRTNGAPIELAGAGGQGTALTFSRDGRWLAVGGSRDSIAVYDSSDGHVVRTLDLTRPQPGDSGVVALVFRPGTNELAAACRDLCLRWFDVSEGTHSIDEDVKFAFRGLSFSADGGRALLSGTKGGGAVRSITLTRDPAQLPVLNASISPKSSHTDDITSACYSADGSMVLTTSKDGSVRAWYSSDGSPFMRREGFDSAITCGSQSSALGSQRVITGCANGRVSVWPLDPLPIARARRRPALNQGKIGREVQLAKPLEYR